MKPKKEINLENIPFQVSDIIKKLLTSKDKDHVKENYLQRLLDIRNVIDYAIDEYNVKLKTQDFFNNPKKK